MAPQQAFLWVSMDSQGKVGSSSRQNSNIKSHCAQYHHQVNRPELGADLEVPEPTAGQAHNKSMIKPIQPTLEHVNAACAHQRLAESHIVSDSQVPVKAGPHCNVVGKSAAKRKRPQAWRTARCHRFRKQSTAKSRNLEHLGPSTDVLEQLPTETDANEYDMLHLLHTAWLPCTVQEQHSAANRRNLYFDSMISDPLTPSVSMTAQLSRAAFLAPSPAGSPSTSTGELIPLRHNLDLYKLSAIAIIRQQLSQSSSVRDPSIFRGIITLAGCAFMADSPREGRLHLEACLEIAHARGGLATLPDLELELTCLADFGIAALSGRIPCTPVAEMEVAVYSRIPRARNTTLTAQTEFAKLDCFRQGKGSEIREGLATLLDATKGINQSLSTRPRPQDRDNLVLHGLFAGYRLCTAAPQEPYTGSSHILDAELDISEALRLAGMLVVAATCLKNTPKQHLCDRLADKMIVVLQHVHISSSLLRSTTSAMLWTYCIGASITSRSPKQIFFLKGIAQLAGLVSLDVWKAVRHQLKMFPYIDQEFDGPFEEIWNSAMFWAAESPP